MIKASDINNILQEAWVSVYNQKLELLENPSSWREAWSEFRKELNALDEDAKTLRFIYLMSTNSIYVWVAAYAIHMSVINTKAVKGKLGDMWLGEFSDHVVILRKPVHGVREITKLDIPKGLMAFLSGLKIHTI
jgi:hypothetical protein